MGQYDLYYEALETSRDAFTLGLFVQAHQSLSRALHYAFALRIPRRLAKVEVLAREQLEELEVHCVSLSSPLESDEVSHYRTLVELAVNYRDLAESAFHCDVPIVTSSGLDEPKVEDSPTVDACYRIDRANDEMGGLWCETISLRQKVLKDKEVRRGKLNEVAHALDQARRLLEEDHTSWAPLFQAVA